MVSWLEDQVIRHLPIEERAGLRDVDSNDFLKSVQDYLVAIECPYKWEQSIECLDWLVNFALRLEYEDKKEHESSDKQVGAGDDGNHLSTFASLDWSTPDVTQAVDRLAESLNIACHPDRQVTLEAVLRLLLKKQQQRTQSQEVKLIKGPGYTLDTTKLGSSGGSNELAKAEKVLGLVHLNQLRSIQNVVNDLTVIAQSITAEPKTDASLAT